MVIHKNLYGEGKIFSTMSIPLANNNMGKYPGLIKRGIYQEDAGYRRQSYEPVSYLWIYIDPRSDSSYDD